MDIQHLHEADLAIRQLDAQERIVEVKVSSFPHMRKGDGQKFLRSLHKMAYPREDEKPKAIELNQLAEFLGVGR